MTKVIEVGNGQSITLAFADAKGTVEGQEGYDACFIVDTSEEVSTILSCIEKVAKGGGMVNLSMDDVKDILHDGCIAYYADGEGTGEKAMEDALKAVEAKMTKQGIDLFRSKELLLSVDLSRTVVCNMAYVMSQLNVLSSFESELPDGFEVKWSLQPVDNTALKVSIIVAK